MTLNIIGRYPPPIDGQSLATQNLADLLQREYKTSRFNMTLTDRALLPSGLSGACRTLHHYLGLKPKLKRHLADGNPVLWANISCQTLGHWRDLLTIAPCLRPAQPLIAVVHWGIFARLFEHWTTAITARLLVKRLSAIVVLSHELANQVADWVPAEKIHVIPNYVQPLASKKELITKHQQYNSSKTLNVLFLGHMIRQKGCYDLLKGLAIAATYGLAIDAHFAGRWNHSTDEKAFQQAVRELDLTESVSVHGPIEDRNTVAELHRNAHVFALPSVLAHEAQPLAIMEALSAATPVILTQRPVFEALVNRNQGAFPVPPHSPEAIAQALISLNDEATWRNSSLAAQKRYETAYSPEAVRQRWIKLIQCL